MDVSGLSDPLTLTSPQIWPNYRSFFEYLLDEEEAERAEWKLIYRASLVAKRLTPF
jgi:hypothetical protein